jgi:hypothetical protein
VATLREMLLEAAVLTAPAQLQARGFLQKLVPEALLVSEVAQHVQRVSRLAPQAARLNKQTLRALHASADRHPSHCLAGAYAYAASAEHQRGRCRVSRQKTC